MEIVNGQPKYEIGDKAEYRAWCINGDLLGHAEVERKAGGWWAVDYYGVSYERSKSFRTLTGALETAEEFVHELAKSACDEWLAVDSEHECRHTCSHTYEWGSPHLNVTCEFECGHSIQFIAID